MKRARIGRVVVALLTLLVAVGPSGADIDPNELVAVVPPGGSVIELKTVCIPEIPPKADVVFAFDLTGSMGGIIATAKSQATNIMTALAALPDNDIQFGVMSYMDYPHDYYDYCGYTASYGGGPDYAYSLDQSVTGVTSDVADAINDLSLGWGNDGPQDYTRIFYESYADGSVAWRDGAKRILVNFGDNVPHDCDLNEGVDETWVWSTGGDPGRDEVMETADDLDLQAVLLGMSENGVVLLESHTTSYASAHWDYWTGLTGGSRFTTSSSTLVEDIVTAVEGALDIPAVYGLHLEASSGFVPWIGAEPSVYPGPLYTDDCVPFVLTITVPEGTEDGAHEFTISAVDDKGVSYGEQSVTIVVPIEVFVDIKPQSCPNPINVKGKGVLPVAVLGTEDFDVTTIDPATIVLMREETCEMVSPLRWAYEDVATPFEGELCDCHELGPDGYLDLTLKFDTRELVEKLELADVSTMETVRLTLTGTVEGGHPIQGSDCVRVQ